MKHLSFLMCLLGGLALPTCAQDRPPTVEIFLQSDGDLHLSPATDRRANTNKNNTAKNDTLIRFHQQEQETKVFTRTQPAGQRHDPLRIDVPTGSVVDLRAQRGTVLAQGLNGHLMGSVQGGSLTLRELRGSVELVSEQGDIHLSDSQVEGMLLARKGNITLQDSPGSPIHLCTRGEITAADRRGLLQAPARAAGPERGNGRDCR